MVLFGLELGSEPNIQSNWEGEFSTILLPKAPATFCTVPLQNFMIVLDAKCSNNEYICVTMVKTYFDLVSELVK